MANYNKSFNFRNGVQVDNNHFIINANGLVGIGSTIPTQILDVTGNVNVVGDIKSTGLTTTNTLYAGIATVGFLTATQGLSVSGVVSATSFSGSASGLTGIYAIAVNGWYVSAGSISTTSNVGIGTTSPQGTLQIGSGVTINSSGNATYSGIITASSFSGSGSNIINITANNINAGILSNSFLPSNINISGIITASSGFAGTLTGNVTGNVTGSLTGIAQSASSLTGTPDITVGNITASTIGVGFATAGIATIFTSLYVGSNTNTISALSSGSVGIGTALPTSDLQIRKTNATLLEVISDTLQASISIGQSVGVGKSTAVLRVGNTTKNFDIINNDTGNINTILHNGSPGINTGRFDWLYGQNISIPLMSLTYNGNLGIGLTNPSNTLHIVGTSTVTQNAYFGNNVIIKGSVNASSFNFPSVISNVNLNTLTGVSTFYDVQVQDKLIVNNANVGIGTTNPIANIDAQTSTVLIQKVAINTTIINSNQVFSLVGGSTFDSVGIGTTNPLTDQKFSVYGTNIGIYNSSVGLNSSSILSDNYCSVGIGTTTPQSTIDFSSCGPTNLRYMISPKVSTTTRNTFINTTGVGTIAGAIIYNTTTYKHQGYGSTDNGVTFKWQDLY